MTRHRLTIAALLVFVLACACYTSNPLTYANTRGPISYGQDASDPGLIATGLMNTPTFRDTLKWWSGPWVVGPSVAFYRPLTSTIWWLQYKTFGNEGIGAFQTIHRCLHLVVVALMFGFLTYLLGNYWKAALAASFFGLFFAGNFDLPTATFAIGSWHDDPEMWLSICYIGAGWAFTAHLRTERRLWLGVAVAVFIVGLMFKEMMYSLPLLLAALLWHEGKLRTHWRLLLVFVGVAVVAFAYRTWALQGLGFRFGSNGAWGSRMATNMFGLSFSLLTGNLTPVWPLLGLATIGAAVKRRWALAGLLLGLAAGAVALTAWKLGVDFTDALSAIADETRMVGIGLSIVLLFLLWQAVQHRPRAQIMAWLWIGATYAMLIFGTTTNHTLYLCSIGWAWWLSEGLWYVGEGVLKEWEKPAFIHHGGRRLDSHSEV